MFVICSTGARNDWGAKIALQIDFELKKLKSPLLSPSPQKRNY
jgi:hypothetical protein